MSNDIYHQEIYTHKSGKKYHVCWYYDHDYGSPLENGDCYGVTERMDWNPTDEEQLEQHIADNEDEEGEGIELEEHTRLTMMRQLQRPSSWNDSGLYYDVLSSLHKAKTEWGIDDPVKAMEVVEKDFDYLKGWYDDDWFWLTVGVAPLDEDGDPVEDDREYCGGYESMILDDFDEDQKRYKAEVIEDQIHSVEWAIKKRLHKGQLELELV
jgi:hypothetical protein